MASKEATERRRDSRRIKSGGITVYQQTRAERDREMATRMTKRFFPGQSLTLMHLDPLYWYARKCGWDVESPAIRTAGRQRDGTPILSAPTETKLWRWWSTLHWTRRNQIVEMSRHRLVRYDRIEAKRLNNAERRAQLNKQPIDTNKMRNTVVKG